MFRPALIIALLSFWAYQSSYLITRPLTVGGVFRTVANTPIDPADLIVIPNTKHCEDLHLHAESQLLFTACEAQDSVRHEWFPPVTNFNATRLNAKSTGTIHVIDPKTHKNTPLKLKGFKTPFVTHGIDVFSDPKNPSAVYIYAVNHLPNTDRTDSEPHARSVIELFHHVIGTSEAKHIRTIWHPLIRTPNDIVALSPTTFLVTNDHGSRDGIWHMIEDIYHNAHWTDTIYVDFTHKATKDSDGVTASIATNSLHNNNGLGHGKDDEIVVVSAAGGQMFITSLKDKKLHLQETVNFDSTLDNPVYFKDPYGDKDGYIMAGMPRAFAEFFAGTKDETVKVSAVIWKATRTKDGWDKEIIFEDDGERLRGAAAAVLLPIEPKDAERKAWLWATGPFTENLIAVKINI